jgi:hypothetical protein
MTASKLGVECRFRPSINLTTDIHGVRNNTHTGQFTAAAPAA